MPLSATHSLLLYRATQMNFLKFVCMPLYLAAERALPDGPAADAVAHLEANIERWYGQFVQPDGGSTKDKASTKKLKVAGRDVTLVDIAGTYKDSPGGPFAGGATIDRPGYRMLAAIVEGPDGNYFLKFYGPTATVEQHADGFRKMIEGMVPAK